MTAFSPEDRGNSTTERLQQIFREVLNEPDLVLSDELSTETLPSWDSLAHISLMFSVESEFGITFSDEEMSELSDAGALRRAVMERTGSAS